MDIETKQRKGVDQAGGVQSLRRAMHILQAVAETPQGIGLTDICKRVKLHNSTAFHIAKTLVSIGLLRQEPTSRHYRIGPQLFGIAAGALDELELLNVGESILTDLAQKTEAASHIAVRGRHEVVIIGKYESSSTIRIVERIGSVRPAHATAIGKILLAALTPKELDEFFARTNLASFTPATIVDEALLRKEISEVQKNSLAFDNGEFHIELRCFAAPVYNFRGRVVAAVGVSVPVWRLHLNAVGAVSASVRQAASDFSAALGFVERTLPGSMPLSKTT